MELSELYNKETNKNWLNDFSCYGPSAQYVEWLEEKYVREMNINEEISGLVDKTSGKCEAYTALLGKICAVTGHTCSSQCTITQIL